MEDARARFLRDRVLTASPAQRVVMLYDRLLLDLRLAAGADDSYAAGTSVDHAVQVLAELSGSLDQRHGGPAENLAAIYSYLIGGLLQSRIGNDLSGIDGYIGIVEDLRSAWAQVAMPAQAASPGPANAWVG